MPIHCEMSALTQSGHFLSRRLPCRRAILRDLRGSEGGTPGASVPQKSDVCLLSDREINVVLSLIVPLHGGAEAAQSRANQTRRDDPMFTRAQFLRLSSVARQHWL